MAVITIESGCEALIACAGIKPNERVLVLTTAKTTHIGRALMNLLPDSVIVEHRELGKQRVHGEEPPADIAQLMASQDVIFGLTSMSLAHTQARIQAGQAGARYLSLPDYTDDVISCPALQAPFSSFTEASQYLADLLTKGSRLRVLSQSGTDISFNIEGRIGNSAPGTCFNKGGLASPPDAESNIAPVETYGEGKIVVDGSIPCDELGLLDETVTLTVSEGRIVSIDGGREAEILKGLFANYSQPDVKRIAEVGIGLNPMAELKGSMLEDEGVLGTVHFGFGANQALGGKTNVPFHLDHIVRDVSVLIDDQEIIKDGKFQGKLRDLYPKTFKDV